MNQIKMKQSIIALITVIALIILDQITKLIVLDKLKDHDAFVLIPGVFELRYLENRGAAFGMMQNMRAFFVVITIVVLAGVLIFYYKTPETKKYFMLRSVMVLIAAGAVGNFIDRVFRQYVVDFFYFSLINFPIFNVADIYVTCSMFLLVFLLLFYYKDEDLQVYSFKKN